MKNRTFYILIVSLLIIRACIISHLGFIDDEAYHWSWAKHISYSYFDHPGMVAWIIYPFIKMFGDVEWAIRMPSFLLFISILFIVYRLSLDLFNEATAKLATLMIFFIPLWGFASLGTMPDVPLGVFWILCVWIFWQSVRPDDKAWSVRKTWLLLGVVMGLGMNSKLTCCLVGLGMGLYLLASPRLRRHLLTPWPYVAMLITFAMMTPIFVWNAKHDWATFDYQFLSRHQEAHYVDWNRWLQFWSYQWLFMSPVVYFLMLVAFIYGLKNFKNPVWRFIVCLPLPALALFYYQPLMSAYKPHWAGPAYMILLPAAAYMFLQGWPGFFKPRSKVIASLAVVFLIPFQLMYIPLFTPVIPKIFAATAPKFAPDQKWNPTWDFTNEFYGWKELGAYLHNRQAEIEKQTGKKPFVAGQRYEIMAQLTWGMDAFEEKIWQLCHDRDQFFFEQSPADEQSLVGQDFLVVNTDKYERNPQDAATFESCEKSEWPFYRGDTLARVFNVYYCKNFQRIK